MEMLIDKFKQLDIRDLTLFSVQDIKDGCYEFKVTYKDGFTDTLIVMSKNESDKLLETILRNSVTPCECVQEQEIYNQITEVDLANCCTFCWEEVSGEGVCTNEYCVTNTMGSL